MNHFPCADLKPVQIYHLLTKLIIPRPIAWVSTVNSEGFGNLAPFSFFMGVSSEPPTLAISIRDLNNGTPKDTLRNIQETKEFVVNFSPENLGKEITVTAQEFEYGENELEKAGLTSEPTTWIRGFRVKESPAAFECQLQQVIPIGEECTTHLVLGTIVGIHAPATLDEKGRVHMEWLKPLARLGSAQYARLGEIFDA